jgi:hypothetical protein
VQPVQIGCLIRRRLAGIKHSFGALQKLGLLLGDLRGVDIELGGQFGQRLLASNGF